MKESKKSSGKTSVSTSQSPAMSLNHLKIPLNFLIYRYIWLESDKYELALRIIN